MNITPTIKKAVIGAILGSILGYAYYHFYGCERGCAITGNPLISTIYGGIMGSLFIASFQKESQKEE